MILTLEQQVCSLESAKKLKELGFRKDSLFVWAEDSNIIIEETGYGIRMNNLDEFAIPAYTVAELGEMLPDWIYSQRLDGKRGWICDGDRQYGHSNPYIECWDNNTEAEVRAKMLIYLVENKLIEVKS